VIATLGTVGALVLVLVIAEVTRPFRLRLERRVRAWEARKLAELKRASAERLARKLAEQQANELKAVARDLRDTHRAD
jgi:hypothetical protein